MASGGRPLWVYKAMIVAATVIWGLSFVVMKDAVDVVEPGYLIGIRFVATGVLVAALFWKNFRRALNPQAIRTGIIFGVLLFAAYWTQTVGLVYTTPGKNAFLTAVYVVLVPFLCWPLQKKRPTAFRVLAACLCLAGIGCVSASGESLMLGYGDLMTLVCAVFFALHIVYVNQASPQLDMMGMTAIQFFTMGVLGLLFGLCPKIEDVGTPLIHVLQAIPPVCWVVLALVWFGFNGKPCVFIVATATVPTVVINLSHGVRSVDPQLLEMARLYQFSRWKMLRHVTLPSIRPYFRSALEIVIGGGWKLAVMGEVLTTNSGIGGAITTARLNIEPDAIIAWSLLLVLGCYLTQRLLRMAFCGKEGVTC